MCKKAVEKRPYLLQYVPDEYRTKEMYERAALGEPKTLYFCPDRYKKSQDQI